MGAILSMVVEDLPGNRSQVNVIQITIPDGYRKSVPNLGIGVFVSKKLGWDENDGLRFVGAAGFRGE